MRTRVLLARGDLAAARRWATDRGFAATDDLTYVGEFEHTTFVRVLIARAADERDDRHLVDALALLARLRAAAERGGRTGSVIEIRILEAAAHQARGDTPAAVRASEDALRLAELDGHVRLFLHAGPGVTEILRSIAARRDAPRHVHVVLRATTPRNAVEPVGTTARPSTARPTLVDELSPRELDVLRLLRSDLSGPDIARELIVSLNTVRTHTKNIYTKLGATNRREAVRRAAELGL
jgi:LuxR family maltose regulon positive regulatory protein